MEHEKGLVPAVHIIIQPRNDRPGIIMLPGGGLFAGTLYCAAQENPYDTII